MCSYIKTLVSYGNNWSQRVPGGTRAIFRDVFNQENRVQRGKFYRHAESEASVEGLTREWLLLTMVSTPFSALLYSCYNWYFNETNFSRDSLSLSVFDAIFTKLDSLSKSLRFLLLLFRSHKSFFSFQSTAYAYYICIHIIESPCTHSLIKVSCFS